MSWMFATCLQATQAQSADFLCACGYDLGVSTDRGPNSRPISLGAHVRQASWSAGTADTWLGVEVQLARRLSASCDGEFGSAVYAKMVSPGSAGSSRASYARVRSPTMGWWKCLTPVRWNRTSWVAHRTRNSSLRVDSSPIRSESSRLYGSRPASARRRATTSWVMLSHST